MALIRWIWIRKYLVFWSNILLELHYFFITFKCCVLIMTENKVQFSFLISKQNEKFQKIKFLIKKTRKRRVFGIYISFSIVTKHFFSKLYEHPEY